MGLNSFQTLMPFVVSTGLPINPFLSFSQIVFMIVAERRIDCFNLSESNRSDFDISDALTLKDFGDFSVEIANDNSQGQIVLSGKLKDLVELTKLLKIKKIKNIQLPVSAPFHCKYD